MNRAWKITRTVFLTALGAGLLLSCAAVRFSEDISAYENKIQALERKVQADSANASALRDLGVIYFQTQHYAQAKDYLQRAFALDKRDAKTTFYLGMTYEFQDKIRLAVLFHERYKEVSRLSLYRRLMEGRYHRLTTEILRQEARQLLAEIDKLPLDRMSPQAIAVLPLRYQGADKKYAPLGKGISEMLIGDLGQVRQLKLLERIRLQALLDEMTLAQHPAFDQSTAPSYGKLMSAGRIIAGTYNVLPQEKLQVDVLSWNILSQQYPAAATQSDLLQNLFRMEKDLVFKFIAGMGIELTPQEREKIQFVPTKNLQAFLAYCQGLESEDGGQFNAAATFYQQAKQLDPGFELAGSKAETAQSLSEAGGNKEEAVTVAQNADPPISPGAPTSQADLITDRLRNLGENVGSNFVPGRDNREPVEEADRAFGELGKPPAPPPRP